MIPLKHTSLDEKICNDLEIYEVETVNELLNFVLEGGFYFAKLDKKEKVEIIVYLFQREISNWGV
jgi:predicted ATP-dependent protease